MSLPTRENGSIIEADWFNSIKTIVDNDLVLTPLSVTADKALGVDANVISASSLSGAIDLDLPAVTDNDKKYYILKATDLTNGVTVNPDGSDTIDGDASYSFSNIDEAIAVVGDATNSNWVIVGSAFDSSGGGGSGTGSASIYALIQPENTLVAEWDTTNLTNATLGLETTAPLAGDSSYSLSTTTAAVAEYCSTPAIAVELRSRAKTNSVSFPYTYDGSDNEITVEVYDNTNSNSLGTLDLEAASTAKTAQLNFYMPESCEEIEFRVNITVTSASELIFDDIEFSDDPITYVDLYNTSDMVAYTPSIVGVGTPTNVDFFWKRDGDMMDIVGSFTSGTPTATELQIPLPSSETILSDITSIKVVGNSGVSVNSASSRMMLATGGDSFLNVGFETSGTAGLTPVDGNDILVSGRTFSFNVRVPIEGWVSETSAVVHSSTGTENTFSARIDNDGTATITSQSTDFISSVSRSALGIVDIVYESEFFSETPAVIAISTTSNRNATLSASSATGCTILVEAATSGGDLDDDFDVLVQRQGPDYKSPSAYAVDQFPKEALKVFDGVTAPDTETYAQIYVDTADGDLKIKFGDGTVKTIVTDS